MQNVQEAGLAAYDGWAPGCTRVNRISRLRAMKPMKSASTISGPRCAVLIKSAQRFDEIWMAFALGTPPLTSPRPQASDAMSRNVPNCPIAAMNCLPKLPNDPGGDSSDNSGN